MSLCMTQSRARSSRARLFSNSSGPDMRNSFSAQRFPVRLCKSAHARSTRTPSSQTAPVKRDSILIPSVPMASTSRSELADCRFGRSPFSFSRRESSIRRPPSLTLGETVDQLSLAEDEQAQFDERRQSALLSHSDTEKEYLYLKKRWQQGADLSGTNPRLTSRCTCQCWERSESIWRTFDDSIHIKLDSGDVPSVKGVGFDHYRKYLNQLEKSQKAIAKRGLSRGKGQVKAG